MSSATFDASNSKRVQKADSDNTLTKEAVGYASFDLSLLDTDWWNEVLDNTNTHSTNLDESNSEYFEISDADQTGLDITQQLTIEAWVIYDSSSTNSTIIVKRTGGSETNYNFRIDSTGNLQFYYYDGSDFQVFDANTELRTGEWNHVAVTMDWSTSNDPTFYINGVDDGIATADSNNSVSSNTAPVYVGSYDGGGLFDGKINNLRVWSEIRTQQEIRENMQRQLDGSETNLEGYWRFNNDATDETSNNNDLTEKNNPTYVTEFPFSDEGRSVRVTDSSGTKFGSETAYSFQLENFDKANQTGIIYFDSSFLSTSSDKTFRFYCGDSNLSFPLASDTLGMESIWDSNQETMQLLEGNPAKTLACVFDSTSTNYDLESRGTMTSGDQVSGKFGLAMDLDGSDDMLDSPDSTKALLSSSPSQHTFGAWIKNDSPGSSTEQDFLVLDDGNAAVKIRYDNNTLYITQRKSDGSDVNVTTSLSDSNWHYVVGTWDGSTLEGYLDGSSIGTASISEVYSTTDPSGFNIGGLGQEADEFFLPDGKVGQGYYRTNKESANWVETLYNIESDHSNYWTVASSSEKPATAGSLRATTSAGIVKSNSSGVITTK